MRMILIALGAIIVLGGGAAGAYFYFMNPAEASATDEVEVDPHQEAKEDDHGGGHHEYVELSPLILPIIDHGGVSQTVSLVVFLEVENAAARSRVEAIEPRLKDAFIQDMYGVLNKHAALKGGVLQVGMLKRRLKKISIKVAGEDTIKDVLLQVVQQRPI